MSEDEVFEALARAGAVIKDTHVVYASKDHGDAYINKDAVFTDPRLTARLGRAIAGRILGYGDAPQVVVSPTGGAFSLATWVAYHLAELLSKKVLCAYADKKDGGGFVLKRGYDKIVAGQRVLGVEDILNSGDSALQMLEAARAAGGNVIGLSALCNRGGVTKTQLGLADSAFLFSLVNVTLTRYPADTCPLCARGVKINIDVGHGREFLAAKAAGQS